LEQYLWFFVDYIYKDWLKWLALAEFVINNKVHAATKVSLFVANYNRKPRMEADIRKKRKVEKAIEFVKRMIKIQEKVRAVLRKAQEKMKQQVDRGRKLKNGRKRIK